VQLHSPTRDEASPRPGAVSPPPAERRGERYLVPAIAAGHRDPVVRELVRRVVRLYDCRGSLRSGLADPRGQVLLPPFPELLQRPPKRAKKGEAPPPPEPDFERRRSDGMEAIVRAMLTIASCTDWVTMEVLDPQGGYLSVARLAELADLPVTLVPPKEGGDRARRRHDRADRALRALCTAQVVAFTKQHREKLEDGHYTSTGPALRKLAVGFFRKFGGYLLQLFEKRRKKLKRKREQEGPTTGDLRVAATLRDMGRSAGSPERTPPPSGGGHYSSVTPPELLDEIHNEHPEWSFSELIREARRRLERGPPSAAPPPDDDDKN
jgi:hypothetical protein